MIGNQNANARFLREHGVADRTITPGGGVVCDTCGGYVVSKAELAGVAGVPPAAASKWLRREPVRPDVAAKLERTVKAVRNG